MALTNKQKKAINKGMGYLNLYRQYHTDETLQAKAAARNIDHDTIYARLISELASLGFTSTQHLCSQWDLMQAEALGYASVEALYTANNSGHINTWLEACK